jgi:hypothetical protein
MMAGLGVVLLLMAVGAAGLASSSTASPASAVSTTSAVSAAPPLVAVVNLHAEFERLAGQVATGPEAGIVPPRGARPAAASTVVSTAKGTTGAATTCTEPNCDVSYNGGPVLLSPKVYLDFWGPDWSSDSSEEQSASYLLSFYKGLGTSEDTWSRITTLYGDTKGKPTFTGSVFASSFIDTSAPPAAVTPDDLAAEAVAAADHFGIKDLADAIVVVASQSGTCFTDGFEGSSCPPASSSMPGYCGWHASASDGTSALAYVNLPYQPDAGSECGADWINADGPLDGFSTVGGHEYAESITDPVPDSGWIDTADTISGGEIADKCMWGGAEWGGDDPDGDITLPTGTFAMQSLWDNATHSCRMSLPAPAPPAPPEADGVTSGLGKTSETVSVSTTAKGDLLVAYVAGRGPAGKAQSATVTAAGLKWTLVARADTGRGDAEVWYARAVGKLSKVKVTAKERYAGWPLEITVVSYKNASGIGGHAVAHAGKGAPTGSLITSKADSWVFAVGDDWAKAAARTPGAGQKLISHATDPAGDTYWVQAADKITPKAGTRVTINDTKPATDPYNLVLVEIL